MRKVSQKTLVLPSHRFRHRSLEVITSNASTCTSSSSLLVFWFFFKICQMYRNLFARERKISLQTAKSGNICDCQTPCNICMFKISQFGHFFSYVWRSTGKFKGFFHSWAKKYLYVHGYNYVPLTGHITIWHIFKGKIKVWGANHKTWFSQSMFKLLNCRVWHDSSVLCLKQMLQLNELTQAKSVSWWHVQPVVHVTTKLLCTVISGIRVKKNA